MGTGRWAAASVPTWHGEVDQTRLRGARQGGECLGVERHLDGSEAGGVVGTMSHMASWSPR